MKRDLFPEIEPAWKEIGYKGERLYIPNFLSKAEADELFDLAKSWLKVQPDGDTVYRHKPSEYMGKVNGKKRIIGIGSFSFSNNKRGLRDGVVNEKSGPLDNAPEPVKRLAKKLTELNHKRGINLDINYLSFIGYEDERDHIDWHQHNEDRCRDATVYILSMGATRAFGIRCVCLEHRVGGKACKRTPNCGETCNITGKKLCPACKAAKKGRKGCPICESEPIYLQPEHGSLIILPHDCNHTHEHAVLGSQDMGGDKHARGLRISVNTKHLRPEDRKALEDAAMMNHGEDDLPGGLIPPGDKVFLQGSGAGMWVVGPGAGTTRVGGGVSLPRVWDCHAGKQYPKDSVYVGCKVRLRNSRVVREGTPYGNEKQPGWKQEDGYCPTPSRPISHQHDAVQWGPRQAYVAC